MGRKRANNEGTIYFREDRQAWCAQITIEGHRMTTYARTQHECRDWIRDMLVRIRGGTHVQRHQDHPGRFQGNDPADIARRVTGMFGFKTVLITMRKSLSAQHASITSLAYADGNLYTDRRYEIETIGPLGGGDANAAGFLTGYLEGDIQNGVRLGNAFSALQQTAPTDLPWSTRAEVDALIAEGGSSMRR